MKPYGFKLGMWRDEDGGPTSKYRKCSSQHRHRSRQLLHKTERAKVLQQIIKFIKEQ